MKILTPSQIALQGLIATSILSVVEVMEASISIGNKEQNLSIANLQKDSVDIQTRLDLIDKLSEKDGKVTLAEQIKELQKIMDENPDANKMLQTIAEIRIEAEAVREELGTLRGELGLANQRIDKTKELLQATTQKVGEVGERVGVLEKIETITTDEVQKMIDNTVPAVVIGALRIMGIKEGDVPQKSWKDFKEEDIIL